MRSVIFALMAVGSIAAAMPIIDGDTAPEHSFTCKDGTFCQLPGKCGNGDLCTPTSEDLINFIPGVPKAPATCSDKTVCQAKGGSQANGKLYGICGNGEYCTPAQKKPDTPQPQGDGKPQMAPYKCSDKTICKANGKCAGNGDACTPPPQEYVQPQGQPDPKPITAPYKCSDKTICKDNGKCAGNGDACTPPQDDSVIQGGKPRAPRDPATCPKEQGSCRATECGSANIPLDKEVEGETGTCGYYSESDLQGCPCTVHIDKYAGGK